MRSNRVRMEAEELDRDHTQTLVKGRSSNFDKNMKCVLIYVYVHICVRHM